MQFLKTLFWVVLAVILVVFSSFNWNAVTIRLWGGLVADVKLPVLILIAFLLGFVPMGAFHLARMWRMKRRIEAYERQIAAAAVIVAPVAEPVAEPPLSMVDRDGDRIATDSKVWPAS